MRAGKSTLACSLGRELHSRGKLSYVLDGDNLRHGLNKNLGFSAEDRTENIRRVGKYLISLDVLLLKFMDVTHFTLLFLELIHLFDSTSISSDTHCNIVFLAQPYYLLLGLCCWYKGLWQQGKTIGMKVDIVRRIQIPF